MSDPDGYVIDATAYRNLRSVMTRLYNAGDKRLTGDDIRDLANTMDANLSRATPIMADDLKEGNR
jgi:hypothetical protein